MIDAAGILALLDKHAPTNAVASKIGLTPAQVRAAAARFKPVEMPTPREARRSAAKMMRRAIQGKCGRRGLPEYVWRAMYQEYCTGKSLAEVARIFGGTRQSVFDVFRSRGLKLRPCHSRRLKAITYGGRCYTPGKDGYYRATNGDRQALHHQMWQDANGPIPEGWQVMFKNADHTDIRLDNMDCMPIADVTRYHLRRRREHCLQ